MSEDVPIILVANKVDLEQSSRAVLTTEGEALAEKFGCPFFETSAAMRRHVDDVFHTLVKEIRYYLLHQSPSHAPVHLLIANNSNCISM